jgi:hypothetical protein
MRKIKTYSLFLEEFKHVDKLKWGKAEFEPKELFRLFNDLKDELSSEIVINGNVYNIDKSIFGEIGNGMDCEPEEFEPVCEDENGKPTNSNNTSLTSDNLLKMKKFNLKNGKKVNADKYKDFIKMCRNLFWIGKPYQMVEGDIERLIKESGEIKRAEFSKFMIGSKEIEKMKSAYKRTVDFLDSKDEELNTKGLYKKYPEYFDDKGKMDYQLACQLKYYIEPSWNHFDKLIKSEKEIPLISVIEINGKWYLVGGNRRMSYFCQCGKLPMIWLIKMS